MISGLFDNVRRSRQFRLRFVFGKAFLKRRDRSLQSLRSEHHVQKGLLGFRGFNDARGHLGGVSWSQPVFRIQHLQERVRRGAVILRHQFGNAGRTVTEFRARSARFDDGNVNPEGGDLLGNGFTETFNTELGGVVERISGVGDLSAVGRYLDDSSSALFAKMRDRGADEGD